MKAVKATIRVICRASATAAGARDPIRASMIIRDVIKVPGTGGVLVLLFMRQWLVVDSHLIPINANTVRCSSRADATARIERRVGNQRPNLRLLAA